MRLPRARFSVRGIMIVAACVAAILAARNELARRRRQLVNEEIKQLARRIADYRSKYGVAPESRVRVADDPSAACP
jgi:hypothetical protein